MNVRTSNRYCSKGTCTSSKSAGWIIHTASIWSTPFSWNRLAVTTLILIIRTMRHSNLRIHRQFQAGSSNSLDFSLTRPIARLSRTRDCPAEKWKSQGWTRTTVSRYRPEDRTRPAVSLSISQIDQSIRKPSARRPPLTLSTREPRPKISHDVCCPSMIADRDSLTRKRK